LCNCSTHPELAYQNPHICSLSRFQKSVSFAQTWRVFEVLAKEVKNLFIIIDRIEQCEADDQADLVHQLLPKLVEFGRNHEKVNVIVTSIFDPPEEVLELPLYPLYIDTTSKGVSQRW
jgi:hypothetical protein